MVPQEAHHELKESLEKRISNVLLKDKMEIELKEIL
jgi:hypothetical protein